MYVTLFIVAFILALIFFALLLYTKLVCGYCKCSKHLVGKVVIVTGGNAGIGFETAKDMAERGAKVILACRNEQRGIEARDCIVKHTGNEDVHFKQLDLASFRSVKVFVDDIIKNEKRLDVLINNAGMFGDSQYKQTEDGLLLDIQSNHFGPFLLTCLLLPLLKSSAPSRIINVSSAGHKYVKNLDLDNLNMSKETYSSFVAYANSKLCNILMTTELARKLKGTGVTANAVHPGGVNTNIVGNVPILKHLNLLVKVLFKTPWEGAQTPIYLAVSPEVEGVSGYYYDECSQAPTTHLARDENLAQKLWELSEKVVKLK